MIVGTLSLHLHLARPNSLKDKRRILRSLKDLVHQRFNVSVAEVDDQDVWQSAVLGISAVGTDTQFVQEVLSNVEKFVRSNPEISIVEIKREIAPFGGEADFGGDFGGDE